MKLVDLSRSSATSNTLCIKCFGRYKVYDFPSFFLATGPSGHICFKCIVLHLKLIARRSYLPHVLFMAADTINYMVRVPRSLKDAMKEDAERHSRSLNAHFCRILELYFDGELVPVNDLAKTPAVRSLVKEAIKEATK